MNTTLLLSAIPQKYATLFSLLYTYYIYDIVFC